MLQRRVWLSLEQCCWAGRREEPWLGKQLGVVTPSANRAALMVWGSSTSCVRMREILEHQSQQSNIQYITISLRVSE